MTQILALFQSIEFWTITLSVVGVVIGLISAWAKIEEWMIKEPVVYIGKNMKAIVGNTIHLSYVLPVEHKTGKAIVPLPLIFSNRNRVALEKFFVFFSSQSKATTDKKGWVLRLLPYNDYFAASEQKNELLHNNSTNYSDGMQTIGNVDYGIDFASKTIIKNLLVLNLAGDDAKELWDECSFKLVTGAKSCETREYLFSVRAYYTDDIDKKKAELQDWNDKNDPHLIITPLFSRVAVNQDGLLIALYEMGE